MRFFERIKALSRGAAVCCVMVLGVGVFAASYADNTYHKLAEEYLAMAEAADEAGEYVKSFVYAQKAKENAQLSMEFIANMTARDNSEVALTRGGRMLRRAKRGNIEEGTYTEAEDKLNAAQKAYDEGEYEDSLNLSNEAIAILSEAGVIEAAPLPEYYVVDTWENIKDCLWNIAARPYIYNDARRWKKLYNENKNILRQPSNPNLIHPSLKLHIPKLQDEYREGVYDPNEEYETIGE